MLTDSDDEGGKTEKKMQGISFKADGVLKTIDFVEKSIDEIDSVYKQRGMNIDAPLENEWSGLMIACHCGRPDLVEHFLESLADPNYQADRNPLHIVCGTIVFSEEYLKCAKLLIQYGAYSNMRDKWNNTPLLLAAREGHVQLVKLFIRVQPDLNDQDDQGMRPISHAIENGHLEVVDILIEAGADLTFITDSGLSVADMCYLNDQSELGDRIGHIVDAKSGKESFDMKKYDLSKLPTPKKRLSIKEESHSFTVFSEKEVEEEASNNGKRQAQSFIHTATESSPNFNKEAIKNTSHSSEQEDYPSDDHIQRHIKEVLAYQEVENELVATYCKEVGERLRLVNMQVALMDEEKAKEQQSSFSVKVAKYITPIYIISTLLLLTALTGAYLKFRRRKK